MPSSDDRHPGSWQSPSWLLKPAKALPAQQAQPACAGISSRASLHCRSHSAKGAKRKRALVQQQRGVPQPLSAKAKALRDATDVPNSRPFSADDVAAGQHPPNGQGLTTVQALRLWQGMQTCTALQHLSCQSAADAVAATGLLAVTVPAPQPGDDQHLGGLCTQAGIPSSLLSAKTRLHPCRHPACHALRACMPRCTGSLAACLHVQTCIPWHLACGTLESKPAPPQKMGKHWP